MIVLPEEYIIEVNTNENLREVAKYFNLEYDGHCNWKYFVKLKTPSIINREDDIPYSYTHLPVIEFKEWETLINKKEENIIGQTIETAYGKVCEVIEGKKGYFALKYKGRIYENSSYTIDKWNELINNQTWKIVKQENMKKYRVIKGLPDVAEGTIGELKSDGYYTFPTIADRGFKSRRYKEAAILASPEYFEEVIEYKVGDWVITEDYSDIYNGKALKIERINGDYVHFSPCVKPDHNFGLYHIKRLATESEIKLATKYIPKVGDYFTVATLFGEDSYNILGKTFKIDKIEPKGFKGNIDERVVFDGPGEGLYVKCIRLATSEEITKFKEENSIPKIGGYKAEFYSGNVQFGCQSYNLENLKAFRMLVSSPVNASIEIQGVKITLEILDKIIKRML